MRYGPVIARERFPQCLLGTVKMSFDGAIEKELIFNLIFGIQPFVHEEAPSLSIRT